MAKIVSVCALAISVMALVFAWQARQAGNQLDHRVGEALARREMALVRKLEPAVRQMCRDFEITAPVDSPQKLEELLQPLVDLITRLSG